MVSYFGRSFSLKEGVLLILWLILKEKYGWMNDPVGWMSKDIQENEPQADGMPKQQKTGSYSLIVT